MKLAGMMCRSSADISDEDWRNRRKWKEHNEAAEDMFEKTSTKVAPWHIIPANFKWAARIQVARTVVHTIEKYDLG